MPVFLDPPVDVTPATLGIYTDVDVSAHVPSSATGAIVRVKNTSAVSNLSYALRGNGASDDLYNALWESSHNWEPVPLDVARIFEARLQSASLSLELTGYFEEEAGWLSPPATVTPSWPAGGTYVDVDIATRTGAETAVAAFLLFEPITTQVFARAKGSTGNRPARLFKRQPILSAVNGSEVLQATSYSASQRVQLMGWMTGGIVADASPLDVTPGTASTWTAHALPAGATGAVFWTSRDGTSVANWGARKKGSGLSWTGGMNYQAGFAMVGADGSGEVELYTQDDIKIYRLAYFVNVDDYDLAVSPIESASDLSSFSLDTGDTYSLDIEPSESASEFSSFDLSIGFDASPPVVALVALPFDATIEVAQEGPPVPAAAGPATDFAFSSFGLETAIYASDVGYDSHAGDTPASMPFLARLQETASFEVRAFEGDRPTGEAKELLGALRLANADGRYDDAALLGFDGRSIDLWHGTKARAFRDFNLLLRGTAERVNFDEATFTIALRDRQAVLDQPINAALYDGGGGVNGHDGIVGLAKPFGLGFCFNVPAVNVDPVNLVYQVHDGQTEGVDEVRDKGIVLTFDADYADYAALIAASIDPGDYGTCLALGLVRLGGSPVGEVTVDFRGDASASGYVENTAEIAERIVTTRLGGSNLSGAEVDSAAIAALAAAQPAPIGYWAGTQQITCGQVLNAIMGGIGGWHSFTRDGRFTVARLTVTGTAVETVTPRESAARQPATRVEVAPVWQIRVAWGRVWQTQSADALAGTVGDDERAFYGQRVRYSVQQDSTIRGRHRLAVPLTVEGFFAEQSDADTEAARLLALYGTDRDIWTLAKAGRIGKRWVSDLVSLDLGRYDHPKTCAVVGIREDIARGESTLVLWG